MDSIQLSITRCPQYVSFNSNFFFFTSTAFFFFLFSLYFQSRYTLPESSSSLLIKFDSSHSWKAQQKLPNDKGEKFSLSLIFFSSTFTITSK